MLFLELFRLNHEIQGIFFKSKMLFGVYACVFWGKNCWPILGFFFALPWC